MQMENNFVSRSCSLVLGTFQFRFTTIKLLELTFYMRDVFTNPLHKRQLKIFIAFSVKSSIQFVFVHMALSLLKTRNKALKLVRFLILF